MGAALPYQSSCCNSCDDPNVQNVPGAKGDPGTDGTDGADGVNAYTTTSANFAMPDGSIPANPVTVTVGSTVWMVVGQILYVENAGWMRVDGITDDTTVDLLNLEDGTGIYLENVAPTTVVPAGSKVSPGGLQGATGATSGAAGGDLEGTYPDPTLGITTTVGDVIVNNNGGVAPRNTRLARGVNTTVLHSDDAAGVKLSYKAVDVSGAATAITGALPIANGGTGQAAKAAAFDALSPCTTKGDLIVRTVAANVRHGIGTNDQVLIADSTVPNGLRWGKLGPENFDADSEEVTTETVILRDVKTSGTDGDTSDIAGGAWSPRDITEISTDTIGGIAVAAHVSGGVTGAKIQNLPVGYYRISVVAVAYQVGYHIIRLKNVSTGSVVQHAGTANWMYGTTEKSPAGSDTPTNSILQGRFQVTAGHEFCIEHYAQLPNVVAGYGKAASIAAVNECYLTIMLEKIAKT